MYVAQVRIVLPFLDDGKGRLKEPGDTITLKELTEAQQTDDDVKSLLKDGAMEKA